MVGKTALDFSLAKLPKQTLVSDLIYVSPETPFLAGVMPEITQGLRDAVMATFK